MTRARDLIREHELEEERALFKHHAPVRESSVSYRVGVCAHSHDKPAVQVSDPAQGRYFRTFGKGSFK